MRRARRPIPMGALRRGRPEPPARHEIALASRYLAGSARRSDMRRTPVSLGFLSLLPPLFLAGSSHAQDGGPAAGLRRDLATAHAEAVVASEAMHDALAALVPSARGWTCKEEKERADARATWMAALPTLGMRCENAGQSLDVVLVLDPSVAAVICRDIDSTRKGIEQGRVVPDLFRFFEAGAWQAMRAGPDLKGCASESVAVMGSGGRTEEALARGPAAVDAFAEALLAADPGPLLASAEAVGLEAALTRLMERLDAQSRRMAEIVPAPRGATRAMVLPSMEQLPQDLRLPRAAILASSPAANVDIAVKECRLLIELSASPVVLHEAIEARGLGRSHRMDGEVHGAFIRLNADRVVGEARVDGTGIEAVVDGSVLVKVVSPGNRPCVSDPGIARRFFDEILANDLGVFSVP